MLGINSSHLSERKPYNGYINLNYWVDDVDEFIPFPHSRSPSSPPNPFRPKGLPVPAPPCCTRTQHSTARYTMAKNHNNNNNNNDDDDDDDDDDNKEDLLIPRVPFFGLNNRLSNIKFYLFDSLQRSTLSKFVPAVCFFPRNCQSEDG